MTHDDPDLPRELRPIPPPWTAQTATQAFGREELPRSPDPSPAGSRPPREGLQKFGWGETPLPDDANPSLNRLQAIAEAAREWADAYEVPSVNHGRWRRFHTAEAALFKAVRG